MIILKKKAFKKKKKKIMCDVGSSMLDTTMLLTHSGSAADGVIFALSGERRQ
jgi:hypothetical protein